MAGSVAVLGAGLIGAGFVQSFRRRGFEVRVWNRTPARAEALASTGASVAASPAEAVRGADHVHLALTDDEAVDRVMEAAAPALSAPVLDHTTCSPAGVLRRAAAFPGVYLHAPIFMGPKNAADATGILVVSGAADLVDRVVPHLEGMTGKVVRVGERPDLAAVYKLCGNGMLISLLGTVSDVIAVARGAGADPAEVLSMFSWLDPMPVVTVRGPRLAREQFGATTFALETARKDVRLMLESAGAERTSVLPALAARMDELLAQGLAREDYTVIARRSQG